MSTPTYRQIVANVRRICATLSLQLPTHETAIASQIRNIRSVHQNLEITRTKVKLLSKRSWRLMQQDDYSQLDKLLRSLIVEVVNMNLLAEEFMSDPEGSLSCLQNVNRRKDILIQQLHQLAAPDSPPTKFPSARTPSQRQSSIQHVEASA